MNMVCLYKQTNRQTKNIPKEDVRMWHSPGSPPLLCCSLRFGGQEGSSCAEEDEEEEEEDGVEE